MANPVLLGAKLTMKRSSLKSVEDKITELITKLNELEGAIEGIDSEEDLNLLETQVKDTEEALTNAKDEKTSLEDEIADLENDIEATNQKKPKAGGKRSMTNKVETREAINEYVRSKGSVKERAGFTSVEGGALIPEELLSPQVTPTEEIDLSKLVNVAKVNSGSGKYPVIKKSGSKMNSVAELAANPELAKPTITEVKYDIATYRGYIPVSQEVIDDADYDVTSLIADEIK
ncbi:phage major capsid protein, partial [Lysinibacillus capsici]|uniref:phage major capsid protein n=1 Tax=Lysinibacillus capsici TaxID=2115968 RepID=UPI000E1FF6DB